MHWSYQHLMDTPADVYEELIAWLLETQVSIDD